jgi:flagellar hook-associated protein 1
MSILSTGVSGLMASQRALATTGHNISSATTEGYSRQRVEFAPQDAQRTGGYYVGQGVRLTSVQRVQDGLVNTQLRNTLTINTNTSVRLAYAERVDNLLADETTGLTPILDSYSAALQDVADDPTALPARITLLSTATTLTTRLGAVNGQLEEQRGLVNGQIKETVGELNQLAQKVADLNSRISGGFTGTSGPPNDLLDQRDVLLNQIAQRVDVGITKDDDGAVNVFVGNGQTLVMGNNARTLLTGNFSGDPGNLDIGLQINATGLPANITRQITGGKLGGLIDTRTNILDVAQNTLGLIGLTLTTRFNEQNKLGLDLNGEVGGDIFEIPAVMVYPKPNNGEMDVPTVTVVDVAALSASDYRLHYQSEQFYLMRQPSNERVTLTSDPDQPELLIGDGLQIDPSVLLAGTPKNGDSWLIQPTRTAASTFEVIMEDPNQIAAASGALADDRNSGSTKLIDLRITDESAATAKPAAIVVNETADAFNLVSISDGAEIGGAAVDSFRIIDPKKIGATPSASVTFDAGNKQFNVGGERFSLDPSGVTTIATQGWEMRIRGTPENGTVFTIAVAATEIETEEPKTTTIIGSGWELDLQGEPDQYDTFTLDLSKGRGGDNRNLLAMTALQDAFLVRGKETFHGSYNSLLSEVSTETRHMQIAHTANVTLLEDAQAQREAVAGVNLDEEAANLLRFQQAYQAAAQVISTSSTLFDTLLNAVRG